MRASKLIDGLGSLSVRRLIRQARSRLQPKVLPRNKILNNRHSDGGRCFVIGNGPSLAGMDLRPLAREFTIAANSFYKHPDASDVAPNYLCIGDPHFMSDEPRTLEWHRTIESRFPDASLILHPDADALLKRHQLYAGHEVFFFRTGRRARLPEEVNVDFSRRLNVGMTTGSLLMLPLALCLGFREIYLLGVDCNWLDDPDASYHFYDTHEFFPEFTSVSTDNRRFTYEDEVRSVLREFESHRLLMGFARRREIRILNATRGGRLDVYPRVVLEEVINQDRDAQPRKIS